MADASPESLSQVVKVKEKELQEIHELRYKSRDQEIDRLTSLHKMVSNKLDEVEASYRHSENRFDSVSRREAELKQKYNSDKKDFEDLCKQYVDIIETLQFNHKEDILSKDSELNRLNKHIEVLNDSRDRALESQRHDLTMTFDHMMQTERQKLAIKDQEFTKKIADIELQCERVQTENHRVKSENQELVRQFEQLQVEMVAKEELRRKVQWELDNERNLKSVADDTLQRKLQQTQLDLTVCKELKTKETTDLNNMMAKLEMDLAREVEFRILLEKKIEEQQLVFEHDKRTMSHEINEYRVHENMLQDEITKLRQESNSSLTRTASVRLELDSTEAKMKNVYKERDLVRAELVAERARCDEKDAIIQKQALEFQTQLNELRSKETRSLQLASDQILETKSYLHDETSRLKQKFQEDLSQCRQLHLHDLKEATAKYEAKLTELDKKNAEKDKELSVANQRVVDLEKDCGAIQLRLTLRERDVEQLKKRLEESESKRMAYVRTNNNNNISIPTTGMHTNVMDLSALSASEGGGGLPHLDRIDSLSLDGNSPVYKRGGRGGGNDDERLQIGSPAFSEDQGSVSLNFGDHNFSPVKTSQQGVLRGNSHTFLQQNTQSTAVNGANSRTNGLQSYYVLQERYNNLVREHDQTELQLKELQIELNQVRQDRDRLHGENRELRVTVKQMTSDAIEMARNSHNVGAQASNPSIALGDGNNDSLRQRYEELVDKVHFLESELDSLQSENSRYEKAINVKNREISDLRDVIVNQQQQQQHQFPNREEWSDYADYSHDRNASAHPSSGNSHSHSYHHHVTAAAAPRGDGYYSRSVLGGGDLPIPSAVGVGEYVNQNYSHGYQDTDARQQPRQRQQHSQHSSSYASSPADRLAYGMPSNNNSVVDTPYSMQERQQLKPPPPPADNNPWNISPRLPPGSDKVADSDIVQSERVAKTKDARNISNPPSTSSATEKHSAVRRVFSTPSSTAIHVDDNEDVFSEHKATDSTSDVLSLSGKAAASGFTNRGVSVFHTKSGSAVPISNSDRTTNSQAEALLKIKTRRASTSSIPLPRRNYAKGEDSVSTVPSG